MLKLILLLIWGDQPIQKCRGLNFRTPQLPSGGPLSISGSLGLNPRLSSISASTGWILMILRSFWRFFMMLNQFMILSKQLQVVLTHFRWKILIFGVAERQTRDYYRFKKTPIM